MSPPFSPAGYLAAHADLAHKLDTRALRPAIDLVLTTVEAGRQVVCCGNGGSAYAASHFITDWGKAVSDAGRGRFRGVSLCDSIGTVTALANDRSYEDAFAAQLEAILDPGDLLVAISTSGRSPNVLKAVEYANGAGARTLAIVGHDGGPLLQLAAHALHVPSFDTQLCEDVHLMFGHMVMKALSGAPIAD
jgi:D-sedoheptulose 7-phosphate isomerase